MRRLAFWLSILFVFTIPWESTVYVGDLGTISRALGILMAGVWGGSVVLGRRSIRRPHLFHALLLAYVLWNYLSILWTIDVGLTRARLGTYAQLFVFCYIVWDLFTDERSIGIALQAFLLGFCVNAGNLVARFLAGEGFRSARFAAAGFDPNNNGVLLAIGIPIAWYLFTRGGDRSPWSLVLRALNAAYIPAALFGILITASRAATITASVALMYVFFSHGRIKLTTKLAVVPALVLALLLLQPYVPRASLERLATAPENIASGDLNGRVEIWRMGFMAFRENPVFGIGSHAFRAATSIGKLDHNTYLSVLFELGMVGFTIFVGLIVITVRMALRLRPQLRTFWLTTLLVLGLGILTLNWKHRKVTWFIPTMIVIQASALVTDPRSPRVSVRPPSPTLSR